MSVQTVCTPDGNVTVRLDVQSGTESAGCFAPSAATPSGGTPSYDVWNPPAAIGYGGDEANALHYESSDTSDPSEAQNESGGADSDDEQEGLGEQDLPLDCPVQSLLVLPSTSTPSTVKLSASGTTHTATWVVCDKDYDPPITTDDRAIDMKRAAGDEPTGLRGGLPYRDGDLDMLGLWIKMYPGDIPTDITRLNETALRTRTSFRPVTESEWVRFWGLIIAARQFNQKGHHLWGDHTMTDGIREAPNFQKYMPYWRFEQIRALVKYSKAAPRAGPNTWEMFNQMVADFNKNRAMMLVMGVWITMDETMSAYQPRTTKTAGLPNISFIKRKPKPLGTEAKTACDCATGVMVHFEVQEGKDAMRVKEHAPELGVTAACTVRMAERSAPAGATMLGDSWFASVKVR